MPTNHGAHVSPGLIFRAPLTPEKDSGMEAIWNSTRRTREKEHMALTSPGSASCACSIAAIRAFTSPAVWGHWQVCANSGCLCVTPVTIDCPFLAHLDPWGGAK